MASLTMRDNVALTATVFLLDFARDIGLDWDKIDTVEGQLERMRHVMEVNTAHQFWINLDLETSNPETARRRIAATLEKVERLLRRYSK